MPVSSTQRPVGTVAAGRRSRSALAAAVLGFFVITLDAVVVNVALRRVRDELGGASSGCTDDVLFGQVWTRPQLSPKERSLVTIACLTTSGNTDQLVYHLGLAKENGVTEEELIEAITHLAFYAGWPKAMAAMGAAKLVFRNP